MDECSFVYNKLIPPTTTIYIVLFFIVGLVATFGNLLSLAILHNLKMKRNNKSNRILISLSLSDLLVGCALCPLTVYQLTERNTLINCRHEFVRNYLSVSLIGTSAINVGLIAYNRYILITSITNHRVNRKKTIALLLLSWIVPPACISLDWVHIYPYIIVLFLIILGPLIGLSVFYCLITRLVKNKEKLIFKSKSSSDNYDRNEDNLDKKNNAIMRKSLKTRHLKLAKQVMFLVMFYVICLLPCGVAIIVNMVYVVTETKKSVAVQNFFLFSLLVATSNSCINPMIYVSKYPDFRSCLRQMLNSANIRTWDEENSHTISTAGTSV